MSNLAFGRSFEPPRSVQPNPDTLSFEELFSNLPADHLERGWQLHEWWRAQPGAPHAFLDSEFQKIQRARGALGSIDEMALGSKEAFAIRKADLAQKLEAWATRLETEVRKLKGMSPEERARENDRLTFVTTVAAAASNAPAQSSVVEANDMAFDAMEWVAKLEKAGVTFETEGDLLKLKPRHMVSEPDRERAKANKVAIVAYLSSRYFIV